MKETIIQSAVTPTINIVIQGEGPAADKTWKLCLDYRACAKVEEKTGIDIKNAGDWSKIRSGGNFPTIVWCCLARYSPDVTEDEVRDQLNPQAHALLYNALFDITFPGVQEAWEAELKKRSEGASPNETPGTKTT